MIHTCGGVKTGSPLQVEGPGIRGIVEGVQYHSTRYSVPSLLDYVVPAARLGTLLEGRAL